MGVYKSQAHGEKREFVVNAILEGIVAGKYRAGDRLVTQEIAATLKVSLTPVREALAELAGVGIVDLLPNRGATIHSFSTREIQEVSRVRRALECEAIRGAVGRIPPSQLKELLKQFNTLSQSPVRTQRQIRLARELDTQLHDLIRDYCGNGFLRSELLRLSRLFRSFRDAAWADAQSRDDCERLAEEAKEHAEIAQALIKRDRLAATKAMSRHIARTSLYWSRGSAIDSPSVLPHS